MVTLNIVKEIKEIETQLSYSKNIGFFLGAGTSSALGIPNIEQLTKNVEENLEGANLTNFKILAHDLISTEDGRVVNIEDILNHVRKIRDITGEKEDKKYLEINGISAKELDIEICKQIYNDLSEKEKGADLSRTKKLMAWLNMQNRDYSKEIYTSNYDLIFERALESIQIPYFDGFVGSCEPFFLTENVERFVDNNDITKSWIRLWKIHGSLSWVWKKDDQKNTSKIVRLGKLNMDPTNGNEIVIYPSKDKYDSSRKQPFIAYFDRLKAFLNRGELLFIISGYSFGDQHINEVLFNCLRQNNRLHIIVFAYTDETIDVLHKLSSSFFNISAFGEKKGIINGNIVDWTLDEKDIPKNEVYDYYWDKSNKKLLLGDFNKLVDFIIQVSGKKETIEEITND